MRCGALGGTLAALEGSGGNLGPPGGTGAIVGVSVSTGSLGVILFLPLTLTHDSNWESLVRYCAPPHPQHFHSPLNPVPLLQPRPSSGAPVRCWGHQRAHDARDGTAPYRCQGATGDTGNRITWRWSGMGAMTLAYRM